MEKNKRKRKNFGLAPGEIIYTGKKNVEVTNTEIISFNENVFKEDIRGNLDTVFWGNEDPSLIHWININGLSNTQLIEEIGKNFNLHPLLLADITNVHQRPKLFEYENCIFLVLKMLNYDDSLNLKIEHISFVLGKSYLLCFQEKDGDVFDNIRSRLKNSKGIIRKMQSDYLMYAIIDTIVDEYFEVIDHLSLKSENLEDQLLEADKDINTIEIQNLKKELLKIRRFIHPIKEVVSSLKNLENHSLHHKTHLYLTDLLEHITQVNENIEMAREMVWGLQDIHMATLNNKMNEVMKTLTIIATIFIPLTFIAGLYGMNFKYMPELEYHYSYFFVLGLMLLLFVLMVIYFKKKNWLNK